jgi:hypothetical protein
MQLDGLDPSEVYFLVLHWLSNGPCREAAAALLREVEQHGLLPRTHAVTGKWQHRPMLQVWIITQAQQMRNGTKLTPGSY